MSVKLVLKNVRLSYAHLFKPWAYQETDDPKWSATVLVSKEDEDKLKALRDAIEEAKTEKFGKKVKIGKTPYRDGDTDPGAKDGYEGHIFFAANRNSVSIENPPTVVGRKLEPLTSKDIWSGCYVNIFVSIYATTAGGNKIAAGLEGIQLVKTGERLDGRPDPEKMFEALDPVDEDDADFDVLEDE